jgi:hypothetical protein
MGEAVISGTRLDVYLEFWSVLDQYQQQAEPPIRALEVKVVQDLLLAAFQNPQTQMQLSALFNNLFSQTLDAKVNSDWQNDQTYANTQILTSIVQSVPSAYNIQTSYPKSGTLSAQVTSGFTDPGIISQFPPGTQGSELRLNLALPGIRTTFNTAWNVQGIQSQGGGGYFNTAWGSSANPAFFISFDGDLGINIGVPTNPSIPLAAVVEFDASNFNQGAANFGGQLQGLWQDITQAFSSFWTSVIGGVPSSGNQPPPSQVVDIPTPLLASFSKDLSTISNALANAPSAGFTMLGVEVDTNPPLGTDPGNTVAITLTHPYDPGPVITNPLVGPSGPSFRNPVIGASATEVNAGGSLTVSGLYFPQVQTNQLTNSMDRHVYG